MIEIRIDEKLCKGCYYCIDMCPKNVLGKSDNLSPKGYIIARVEERICPDFAISVKEADN